MFTFIVIVRALGLAFWALGVVFYHGIKGLVLIITLLTKFTIIHYRQWKAERALHV